MRSDFHVFWVLDIAMILVAISTVNAASGFINLNCGLPKASTTTNELGYVYTSDDDYIDSGEIKSVGLQFVSNPPMYQTLRSFPSYTRNCYDLKPLIQGKRYLIRASFMYGNYDGQNILPIFDIYLGVDPWYTVKPDNSSHILWTEIIVTANTSVNVCLVRTGGGIPFISALEVRPLFDEIYNGTSWLITQMRINAGATGPSRFTDDTFDRLWTPDYNGYGTPISNTSVNLQVSATLPLPPAVLQTAEFSSTPIKFSWPPDDQAEGFFIFLYFSGLIQYGNSETSNMALDISGKLIYEFEVEYMSSTTLYLNYPLHYDGYSATISATNGSTSPSISGFEVYKAYEAIRYVTYSQDINALIEIKGLYNLKKNWVGDPCLPRGYFWEGLNCSFSNPAEPRVFSLDLSNSCLEGPITDHFAQLTAIQSLNLSGNSLKGAIPDSLGTLSSLTSLDLSNNYLSGPVPSSLLERQKNGRLVLRTENSFGEDSDPTRRSHKLLIILVVVASAVILLSAGSLYAYLRRSKTASVGRPNSDEPPVLKAGHDFTFAELSEATDNFHRVIGDGGSGHVYHGLLRGSEVAVKKLNNLTSQVAKQFAAEIASLMRVHHKNLVSFIGYCNDKSNMMIVYEYMPNGNLQKLLSGLEYLHTGCSPPIIHRDIKTSNILLNGKFEAKVADFGLSKTETRDGCNSTTTAIAGTRGYIDPECSITCVATVMSDVYSFGVVLLEIISGQRPILSSAGQPVHITQWAKSLLLAGNVLGLVDGRMEGHYSIESIARVADVAARCTSERRDDRPTMTSVVQELKEALHMELSGSAYEGRKFASVSRMEKSEIAELSFIDVPAAPPAR
ncbi:unnamed protein product [Victoria cruziana]